MKPPFDPDLLALETERMCLRRFTLEDAEPLCELDSDPEVMRYISGGVATPIDVIRDKALPRFMHDYQLGPVIGYFAIHRRTDGAFIGWAHFRPDRFESEAMELGYRLHRHAWGQGYATEAAGALLAAGKAMGLTWFTARCLLGNLGSARVMEKIGLRRGEVFVYPEALIPALDEADRRAVCYGLRLD